MSDEKRSTITVNGQTWVAPEQPEPKEGETAFVMSAMMLGRKCGRCGKYISAWSQGKDGETPSPPVLPEHPDQECDHKIVDDIHDL